MILTGINWLTTYNCNANCKHCFFETQSEKHYMDPKMIDRVFKDFEIPRKMFWNHISGGEIFLNPEKLYDIISRIRHYFSGDLGLSTNGFWGTSDEKVEEILKHLKELGISGLAISSDTFHQEYISLDRPQRVIKALIKSGMERHSYLMGSLLDTRSPHAKNKNSQTQRILKSYPPEIPVAKIAIRSLGKGSILNTPKKKGYPMGSCTDMSECLGKRSPFNPAMVWIDSYGNVMICYGIKIGNINNRPFHEIISSYDPKENPVFAGLSKEGPSALINLAKEQGIKLPEDYYDTCDLCYQTRKALIPHYPEILGPRECYP